MFRQVEKYFKFDERKAIFRKEIIGGISTFLAMCYILAVNPAIVGSSLLDPALGNIPSNLASNFSGGLFLATAISSFLATAFMGLWARIPVALAPGMGLNAFFTFTVASAVGFESALSITIMSGILYLIVAITPARNYISSAIPHNYKIAVGAGIGLFIAYLGLQNSGVIVSSGVPATSLGDLSQPLVITALVLTFVGLALYFAKVPAALLITMGIGAIVVVILAAAGTINNGQANLGLLNSYDDFETIQNVAQAGWLGFANTNMWTNPLTYIAILTFLYTDFFDTTGTLIAIDRMNGFSETDSKWLARANQVDAISTVFGAGIGATTVTSFVESSVGSSAGAKTGFASMITALCFAIAIAIWPIMPIFLPIQVGNASFQPVTSPILIIVGVLMISQIKFFDWKLHADIPMLFMTLIFTVLTNSIADGLSFGMITYVFVNFALGVVQFIRKKKEIVNKKTMPLADDIDFDSVQVKELYYWKQINPSTLVIAGFGLLFLILRHIQF